MAALRKRFYGIAIPMPAAAARANNTPLCFAWQFILELLMYQLAVHAFPEITNQELVAYHL